MSGRLALFRCDAGAEIGGGHVMRCLTLAEHLAQQGWRYRFFVNAESLDVVPVLQEHPHHILDCPPGAEPLEMAKQAESSSLLVIDHYGRDVGYEITCSSWARHMLVLDDLPNRPHYCDMLLDQTFGRAPADYARLVPPDAELMAGSGYALLRPAFAARRQESLTRRERPNAANRLLISVGAADPHRLLPRLLEALTARNLPDGFHADILFGNAAAITLPDFAVGHDFTADVAALMASADVAIGAAGSTAWERCCLGLPTVMLITADNQADIAANLADAGAAVAVDARDGADFQAVVDAALGLLSDDAARLAMAQRAAMVCDGEGAGRVVERLERLVS